MTVLKAKARKLIVHLNSMSKNKKPVITEEDFNNGIFPWENLHEGQFNHSRITLLIFIN
jgi:hypothetical protein